MLALIGWCTLAVLGLKALYNTVHFFYTVYFARTLYHNLNLRRYGPWAVVTGATDGIGEAYAYELAAAGLNIVLVSRSLIKLQEVAYEIKCEYRSIQVRTIAVDFTESQSIYPKLRMELSNLPVGVLVNNVGMSYGSGPFMEKIESGDQLNDIINCNVMSMVRMTHIILPNMVKRKNGLIINVGSIASVGSTPMDVAYGSTKAFVDKFSRDLSAECLRDGVIVQTVLPGYVATKMPHLEGKSSFAVPTAEDFVMANLGTLGVESRTAAYWFHKIMLYWIEMLHFCLPYFAQWLTMKFFSARHAARKMNSKQNFN